MTDEMSNELYYSQFGVEDIEPKFKVGDVVNTANDSRPYVIREAIITGSRLTDRIIYEVAPFDDEFQTFHYQESALEFQYHDDYWDLYLNEAVRNGLPPWRGELYNNYSFTSPDDLEDVRTISTGYEDDTLPPIKMAHILIGHSIYSKMREMVNGGDSQSRQRYQESIMNDLKISEKEMNELYRSIRQKILARNMTDTPSDYKEKTKSNKIPKFTEQEYEFVQEIDKLDKDDHYPVDMTNLQIMDAIREAYKNTEKSGKCKRQKGQENDGSLPAPVNGKKLYLGRSRKYDLIIEFWYNFDLNIIETAYPVRMSSGSVGY